MARLRWVEQRPPVARQLAARVARAPARILVEPLPAVSRQRVAARATAAPCPRAAQRQAANQPPVVQQRAVVQRVVLGRVVRQLVVSPQRAELRAPAEVRAAYRASPSRATSFKILVARRLSFGAPRSSISAHSTRTSARTRPRSRRVWTRLQRRVCKVTWYECPFTPKLITTGVFLCVHPPPIPSVPVPPQAVHRLLRSLRRIITHWFSSLPSIMQRARTSM